MDNERNTQDEALYYHSILILSVELGELDRKNQITIRIQFFSSLRNI